MKKPTKTVISTKIEANKDKIYRIHDIHDLSYMVFPHKKAHDLRTAFILIFLSIKYSPDQTQTTPELEQMRLKKASNISQKTLWKARATMARIGIIERRDGMLWKFSSRFSRSLHNLSEKVNQFTEPTGNTDQKKKEWDLLMYQ